MAILSFSKVTINGAEISNAEIYDDAKISKNARISNSAQISQNSSTNLEMMIGQMIITGFANENEKILKQHLHDGKIGGVLFLERNIKSSEQFLALTSDLLVQNLAITPFLCIDEEGGEVSRFGNISGAKRYKSAREVALKFSLNEAYEMYVDMAKFLKFYHINLNFAPVVDIHNPHSKAIGARNRAYSDDFGVISAYANEFIKAMKAQKIVPVMKHFPGHGNVIDDTHTQIAVAKNYDFSELRVYFEMIKNGQIEAIMSAHAVIPALDSKNPATFSSAILRDLLQKELKFKGIVISDDLLMGGAGNENVANKAIIAIKAGCDVILLSDMFQNGENLVKTVSKAILNAVNSSEISRSQIEQSFEKILRLKQKLREN